MNMFPKWNDASSDNLYKGILTHSRALVSARMMLVTVLAQSTFHPEIYQELIADILDFHEYEVSYYNYDSVQSLLPLTQYQIMNALNDINQFCDKKWYTDINKVNQHHVIWYGHKRWWYTVDHGKMHFWHGKFREKFHHMYPVYVRDKYGKYCTGKLKGENTSENIREMTIRRHNHWLNHRFPWNLLPQHQILAEQISIWEWLNTIHAWNNHAFVNIKRMCTKEFQDLHNEHVYRIIPWE